MTDTTTIELSYNTFCDDNIGDYVTFGDRGLYLVTEVFADRITIVKVTWYTRLWAFIKGLRL